MSNDKKSQTVQTTGHAWDGDLQEFNNPLPRWWLWSFYATVLFAFVYWIFYPAWPIGKSYTKGVLNTIEYTTADNKKVVSHWNTRALFEQDMAQARTAQLQFSKALDNASYDEILKDQEKLKIAKAMAKVLYADNCQACHQAGGAGIIGQYPNLADNDWLWGGEFKQIETTIRDGRTGMMPAFKGRLTATQLEDVSEYVLSLSKHAVDKVMAQRGQVVFMGDGGCYACHTKEGSGNITLGSANLTDSIWTIAQVPQSDSADTKRQAVREVVESGISRKMPVWKDRFTATEIKVLTMYVHNLSIRAQEKK
jgi:cytochrome c oxidase cbb3-type subunit 3